MGYEKHEKKRKILCEKTLLTDLENMKEQVNTTIALNIENTKKDIFWH